MVETSEIIARANEAVQEIYKKMGQIESCEAVIKALDGADVFIGRSKDEILDLHSALNEEQIADIMIYIHTVVKGCVDKEAAELSSMCGKQDTPSDILHKDGEEVSDSGTTSELSEDGVKTVADTDDEIAAPAPEVKGAKASKSTLPPDEEEKLLRRLYVIEGKTVKEIADIMGLTKANIYDRIKKYGLRNKRYDREWDGFASESVKRSN